MLRSANVGLLWSYGFTRVPRIFAKFRVYFVGSGCLALNERMAFVLEERLLGVKRRGGSFRDCAVFGQMTVEF